MSKDQEEKIVVNVETVENWKKAVESISNSIKFWFPHNDNKWPFNFFLDSLDLLSENIGHELMPF